MRMSRAKRGAQRSGHSPIELGDRPWTSRMETPLAVPERLKRRADFLRAAKGKRFYARGLTLQAAIRPVPLPQSGQRRRGAIQTFRRRAELGNALKPLRAGRRRRGLVSPSPNTPAARSSAIVIRRRLKEALRLLRPLPARPGYDYVILARPEALDMSFQTLQAELMRALGKIDTQETSANSSASRYNDPVAAAASARQKSSKGRTPKG